MKFNPERHQRRSIRLNGYDYSQSGAYFITLCVQNRRNLFGQISDGVMSLNSLGEIVHREWTKTPLIRKNIQLDKFVIMPNHFHAIVWIEDVSLGEESKGAQQCSPTETSTLFRPARSLGSMIAQFKAITTKYINEIVDTKGERQWQRNYYEHIVRNEDGLNFIRYYILHNPENWADDSLHEA